MITESLPNGCSLLYVLSHRSDSRIHLKDPQGKEVYCWHFNTDQYLLACRCLDALRLVAQAPEIALFTQDKRVA